MKSFISLGVLFLSSLANSSPISRRSASCPEIFALKISAPGHAYTGLNIIQSGRSTYLAIAPPTTPDSIARFYRNDTIHLYATGFDTSYMSQKQTPPYQLITYDFGFNIFSADPAETMKYSTWVTGTYTGNNDTQELSFVPDDGGDGGFLVCGDENQTVWGIEMGTSQHGGTGCTRVSVIMEALAPISADIC